MNENIGRRIRLIRRKLGLTMSQFGELFEPVASKGVVSNWENNYNLPNNERLKKIAELGNVSLNYLLKGEGEKSDEISKLRDQLLYLQKEKMNHSVRNYQIANVLTRDDLTEDDRLHGEKALKDSNSIIQGLEEAIIETEKYIANLEVLEEGLEKNRELNRNISNWGDPEDIPIEVIKNALKKSGYQLKEKEQSKLDLEAILTSQQEITINGKILNDEEKQKALQILKITFDK